MDIVEPSTVERGLWPIATRAYVAALEAKHDNLRLEVKAYEYLTANIRQALVDRGMSLEDQRVMLDAAQVVEPARGATQRHHARGQI
jgi:hypothetical protein